MERRINNLMRFDKDQKFLFFDTETEDLNLGFTRPWECSFLIKQGDNVLIEHEFFPWWSDLKMSEGAARVTRFNFEEYKAKATDPKEVLDLFDSYLFDQNIIVVGANIFGFDFYVYQNWRKNLGLPVNWDFLPRALDIQGLEKSIHLEYTVPQEDLISWNYKLYHFRKRGLKTSVELLCKKYGIEYNKFEAHSGLYDIRKTAEILEKQLFQIEI